MLSDLITEETLFQGGIGVVVGYILGYALKKAFKVFMVLLGLYIASLLYLAKKGFIEINYQKLTSINLGTKELLQNWLSLILNVPVAGFVIGFIIGLKKG